MVGLIYTVPFRWLNLKSNASQTDWYFLLKSPQYTERCYGHNVTETIHIINVLSGITGNNCKSKEYKQFIEGKLII
jgi:hypothetical protein